jgi:hypothetical protein
MNETIIKYLKDSGEQLDKDMAEALQVPFGDLQKSVNELSARGEIICCKVTRYIEGRKIEGMSCRLSCDLPAPARGRKTGVKKDAGSASLLLD